MQNPELIEVKRNPVDHPQERKVNVSDNDNIISKLKSDSLYRAFYFNDLSRALVLLEAKLELKLESKLEEKNVGSVCLKDKLNDPVINIIAQQRNVLANKLLAILTSAPLDPSELNSADKSHYLTLLMSLISLGLPKLFTMSLAYLLPIIKAEPKLILEFYRVAGHCQAYSFFEILQQHFLSPPMEMIEISYLSEYPIGIIDSLWHTLDNTGKEDALLLLLPLLPPSRGRNLEHVEDLPGSIKAYYQLQRQARAFEVEAKSIPSQKILLASRIPSAKRSGLTELNAMITAQEFCALFLEIDTALAESKISVPGPHYVHQLIKDYIIAKFAAESKSAQGGHPRLEVMHAIDLLQLIYSPDLEVIKFLLSDPDINNNLRKLKFGLLLFYRQSTFDFTRQWLADLLINDRDFRANEEAMRKLNYFDELFKVIVADRLGVDIELADTFKGPMLTDEFKQLSSKLTSLDRTPATMEKLSSLFLTVDAEGGNLPTGDTPLPKTLQQLIMEYWADNSEHYQSLIKKYPGAAHNSINLRYQGKLTSLAYEIELLIKDLKAFKQNPRNWKQYFGSCSGALRIMLLLFIVLLSWAAIKTGLLRPQLAQARRDILSSEAWQPCPGEGYGINQDWLSSNCVSPGFSSTDPCSTLCSQYNDLTVPPGILTSLMASPAFILLLGAVLACRAGYCCGNPEPIEIPQRLLKRMQGIYRGLNKTAPEGHMLSDIDTLNVALKLELSSLESILRINKPVQVIRNENEQKLSTGRRDDLTTPLLDAGEKGLDEDDFEEEDDEQGEDDKEISETKRRRRAAGQVSIDSQQSIIGRRPLTPLLQAVQSGYTLLPPPPENKQEDALTQRQLNIRIDPLGSNQSSSDPYYKMLGLD